ncbi:hypothetical protein C8Q70DRAFT_226781 [Cubamyces menziesii]|uniref:Nicotinamide N-methyltransferase n=1 Tax=Trametes cubensis TaxID=1111947 RepID=A0AAD7TQL0_9APHY|nr:hypothetical protein C8Q70DRAFT_226781 [Cubamyces menziesii]KAJ8474437.1 hypothetical protein ONZ51_g7223 [Trametes cubensis]
MSDPEDVLAESLETLYDYVPVALSSSGSTYTYQSETAPSAITLTIPDTQAANWSLHATSIWSSSIYVANHLQELNIDGHIKNVCTEGRALQILELGAGAGLPSILIAKTFRDVLVTTSDYPDENLIHTLEGNVKRNEVSDRCRVVPYGWGSDPSPLFFRSGLETTAGRFDVVIAADTLWNSEWHGIFIETLRLTLRRSPNARIYLVAGLHTGRYVIQSFLCQMQEAGFVPEQLSERRVDGSEERPWSIDRAEQEDDRERRRWVIWMVFKWADC